MDEDDDRRVDRCKLRKLPSTRSARVVGQRGSCRRWQNTSSTASWAKVREDEPRKATMDLAAVKTLVKNWERAFKAQNHREPTKDDIKQDPSGIGKSGLVRWLTVD